MDSKTTLSTQAGCPTFQKALLRSSKNFFFLSPLLLGIISLVALMQTLVSPQVLETLFRGNPLLDTFTGTVAGALGSGNPIVCYLLSGELLQHGVSLYAISAFILSWVTLVAIQIPAEATVFGIRFTILRNLLAFLFTPLLAVTITLVTKVLQ